VVVGFGVVGGATIARERTVVTVVGLVAGLMVVFAGRAGLVATAGAVVVGVVVGSSVTVVVARSPVVVVESLSSCTRSPSGPPPRLPATAAPPASASTPTSANAHPLRIGAKWEPCLLSTDKA
jgi:hypothetical protein